jgi:cytochrome c
MWNEGAVIDRDEVANGLKHHVTVGNKSEKNPLPANAETVANGRKVFGYYCVACHGLDGQATGVPFAESMSPPIPSLASAEVQSYSDGQLKRISTTASIRRACRPRKEF